MTDQTQHRKDDDGKIMRDESGNTLSNTDAPPSSSSAAVTTAPPPTTTTATEAATLVHSTSSGSLPHPPQPPPHVLPGGATHLYPSPHPPSDDTNNSNSNSWLYYNTSAPSSNGESNSNTNVNYTNNNTPLTGENIVLLSFSNDTTPVGEGGGGGVLLPVVPSMDFVDRMDVNAADNHLQSTSSGGGRRGELGGNYTNNNSSSNHNNNNNNNNNLSFETANAGTTLSYDEEQETAAAPPNNYEYYRENNNADSPPPDSVHSGQLTSLSPPPISIKSSGSMGGEYASSSGRYVTAAGGAGGGGGVATATSTGSIHSRSSAGGSGLFQSQNQHQQYQAQQQQQSYHQHQQQQQVPQQPASVSGGIAATGTITERTSSQGKPKRPPLPPRWAIHGAPLPASHHGGMTGGNINHNNNNNNEHHAHFVPPPQQIGPLSHRRVVSTGDASFLSNLTDPDSIPDGDEGEDGESPPEGRVVGATIKVPRAYTTTNTTTTTATTNAAAAGSGNVGSGAAGGNGNNSNNNNTNMDNNPSGGAATTTNYNNNSNNMNTAVTTTNRKRGVSWDFDNVGPIMSHDHDHSPSGREEQAALESMGILQPILSDEDADHGLPDTVGGGGIIGGGNVGRDGDRVVVMGEASAGKNNSTIETAVMLDAANSNNINNNSNQNMQNVQMADQAQTVTGPTLTSGENTSPQPPLPEKIIDKHRSAKSLWDAVRASPPKRGSPQKPNLIARSKTECTQFEDEADLAILEALKTHNMASSKALLSHSDDDDGGDKYNNNYNEERSQQQQQQQQQRHSSENDDEETKEEVYPIDISPSINASHRKNVSSLTQINSPNPSFYSKGEHRFEDLAWSEAYDAQGRIDGTLREEQDAKLVGGDMVKEGMELYIPPLGDEKVVIGAATVGAAAAAAAAAATTAASGSTVPRKPPLHPTLSGRKRSDSTASSVQHSRGPSKSEVGKRKKEDESVAKSEDAKKAPAKERPGMRHRRGKSSRALTSMAEELAQMAAIDNDGASTHAQHRRNPTGVGDGRVGIDNLLDGVNVLLERSSGLDEGDDEDDEDDRKTDTSQDATATNTDSPNDQNHPHDEETGEADDHHRRRDKAKHAIRHVIPHRRQTKKERRLEIAFHLRVWYNDLIRPKLPGFIRGAAHGCLFVILPLLIVAFVLFYAVEKPNLEPPSDADEGTEQASSSWWVLFVLRQFFILSCVKAGEVISIDILALRTPIFIKTIGSFATLMIVQARGWPYVITFWALADFAFLFGSHQFAKHWLFWQDWLEIFNATNPSGDWLSSALYLRILLSMMFVGLFTSLKRLWLSTFLGKRSYDHYGPELEKILGRMLLVSQIAHLARQIEAQIVTSRVSDGYAFTMSNKAASYPGLTSESEDDTPIQQGRKTLDEHSPGRTGYKSGGSATDSPGDGFGQHLLDAGIGRKHAIATSTSSRGLHKLKSTTMKEISSSSRLQILSMLEEWEEPEIRSNSASKATIKDILQFRQAVSLMDDNYPFTPAFGPASTRALCVDSADALYERLMERTPDRKHLPFETLSEIAYDNKGELIRDKVKALIRLFRPDRRGFLTKLDFVASIDNVYKDLRLFRASLANSSTIDDSFESIINLFHGILAICAVLLIMGFKMWESIASMSAFLLSFSFMFGAASSKYFEGILLIFVRRPYDIGDKIALSDPSSDTSASGSSTWFVEKVTLFSTTVRFATTNEVATYSNGSLAPLRIINAKRSPKAVVYVYHKFGSDAPYKMINVFKTAIENFVKSRPREWIALNGIRATRVEMELNFIEYVIVLTHREMWQNIGPILQSQADLASFGLEVAKKLNLRYISPPKPIHLSTERAKRNNYLDGDSTMGGREAEINQVADMFGHD